MPSRNAAQYLLEFFGKQTAAKETSFTLQSVMMAIDEVSKQLDILVSSGQTRFNREKQMLPNVWKAAWQSFANANNTVSTYNFNKQTTRNLGEGAELMLLDVRDNAPMFNLNQQSIKTDNVNDFLDSVLENVTSDTTLPPSVQQYVAALVMEVRSALDAAKVGEEFILEAAIKHLMAGIYMAEASTKDPSHWETFREKYSAFMRDFLGLVLPNVLAAAGVYLQIAQ